jgi:ArsR family transcriptional regulator
MSKQRSVAAKDCADLASALDPRFFKALADPTRLALLVRLATCGGPCTVNELALCCPIDVSVVSRHLGRLRDAGIIEATRRGKEVYYIVRFDAFSAALRSLTAAIDDCCPTSRAKRKEKRT